MAAIKARASVSNGSIASGAGIVGIGGLAQERATGAPLGRRAHVVRMPSNKSLTGLSPAFVMR